RTDRRGAEGAGSPGTSARMLESTQVSEPNAYTQAAQPSLSVTDLFTIGVGPSSSHTVGPMRAAAAFADLALAEGRPERVACELYGSLALTGKGHATDIAVLLGLSGWLPERVDPNEIPTLVERIRTTRTLNLGGAQPIAFDESTDLVFRR